MRNWCLSPTSHHTPKIVPKIKAATDSVMDVLGGVLESFGRVRASHLAKKLNFAWKYSSATKTKVTQAKAEIAPKGYRARVPSAAARPRPVAATITAASAMMNSTTTSTSFNTIQ